MYEGEQCALYRSLASLGTCTLLKVLPDSATVDTPHLPTWVIRALL